MGNNEIKQRTSYKWHKLLDMEVLTGTGDKLGDQVATVYPNGVWHTWDKDGCGMENGVEISVYKAKCAASFSAIEQGLLRI